MRVYLDLVIILNFLVDFLLLMGTNRLSGFPLAAKRCAAAAVLGALYSGVCMAPSFRFLSGVLWRVVSLAGMAAIAFGLNRSAVKRSGVFVLLSMALGGVVLNFRRGGFWTLVLCAGAVWLLCRIAFGQTVGGREYVPVTLTYGEQSEHILALRDTGNTLRDPITGEPVLVVAGSVGQRLTGLTESQLRAPLETLARRPIPGLRLIPYRAVGRSGGMLLALRMDKVTVGSRQRSAIVAFTPEGLGGEGLYQGLVTAE